MTATVDKACHEVIEVGPLEILPEEHLARAQGRALMLSIRELRLLTELARRADRIMAREELFGLVWGREMRPGDRSVDVYVRKLRVKLEDALPGWRFIHTHFGFGYRLTAERYRLTTEQSKTETSGSQPINNSHLGSAET
jgi:DNA-binding response OmpR family regulator